VENLTRIRSGIQYFWVPKNYETNKTIHNGWMQQGAGGPLRAENLSLAQSRLKELLGLMATYHYHGNDMVNAAIYATALRQLCPEDAEPKFPQDPGTCHDHRLHLNLNRLFAEGDPPNFMFWACDSLLKMLKAELARHGITDLPPTCTPEVDG
jgi:hypothetical protein